MIPKEGRGSGLKAYRLAPTLLPDWTPLGWGMGRPRPSQRPWPRRWPPPSPGTSSTDPGRRRWGGIRRKGVGGWIGVEREGAMPPAVCCMAHRRDPRDTPIDNTIPIPPPLSKERPLKGRRVPGS